jgi:hypothetical protein
MNASHGGPNNEGDMQDTLLVEACWEHDRQDLFFFLVVGQHYPNLSLSISFRTFMLLFVTSSTLSTINS